MATVSVSNFSEFVSAVAVSGNTVNLPVKAVWDMNDEYPEGYTSDIPINCAVINGNGTEIKNLHLYGKFVVPADLEINDLFMTNVVCEDTVFFGHSSSARTITANGSIFTGIYGVNARYFNSSGMQLMRTTINIDMTTGRTDATFVDGAFTAKYCRLTMVYPNGAASVGFVCNDGDIQYCLVNITMLGATSLDCSMFSGCVILGNYGEAYDSGNGGHGSQVSVYDVAAFDSEFEPESPLYFKGVTYSQLYDAAYLQSIGFPIGA